MITGIEKIYEVEAKPFDVSIIGGGLAGLISAIYLSKMGWKVVLFEKRTYPEHRVCGEYVSNEVVPFLNSLDAYPDDLNPKEITRFELSATSGRAFERNLDLGGFGISRYLFDDFLHQKAKDNGAMIMTKTLVDEIDYDGNHFKIKCNGQTTVSKVAIGAFGKRSALDKTLNRSFFSKRSPYVGVKFHLDLQYPENKVALHNFDGGYCGICAIENNVFNVCYLVLRSRLRKAGSIEKMEQEFLYKNPIIKDIFESGKQLFEKPLVINEISFETKEPVFQHILMVGDSAGMITPLCGNGMAMAIHSAKICCEFIDSFLKESISRSELEVRYSKTWKKYFALRLRIGRSVQNLFGSTISSSAAVTILQNSQFLGDAIIASTHGDPF